MKEAIMLGMSLFFLFAGSFLFGRSLILLERMRTLTTHLCSLSIDMEQSMKIIAAKIKKTEEVNK